MLLGIPANTGGGSGYTAGTKLEAAIQYSETFTSFGGIMMWDMSQLYQNRGFLDEVEGDLGSGGTATSSPVATPTSSPTSTSTSTSTTTTTSPIVTSTAIPQWGQCGGTGYTGSSTCASPYSCTCLSVWWCQCE